MRHRSAGTAVATDASVTTTPFVRSRASLKVIAASLFIAAAAAACGSDPGGADPHNGDGGADDVLPPLVPGQTGFINEEPSHSGNPTGGADAGVASSPSPSAQQPPSGRLAEVQEADIYRVSGNNLFYFNTYRGFLVYDVTDRKKPTQLSRLPVYGYPVEMFVSGNVVYALIRDALYMNEVQGKLAFQRHNVSQLVSIDVSDVRNPRVLKTIDIVGQLREGVSRKIENTIYVVSSVTPSYWWGWGYNRPPGEQKEQATVYSFDVADANNTKLVQSLKLFEGGNVSVNSPDQKFSYARYFQDVNISATSNALMVVENWQVTGSGVQQSGCPAWESSQRAIVSIVDVSDPLGKIRVHTRFETPGRLTDQFKQTYVHDPATNTGTYFGIFARQGWQSVDCQGQSVTRNSIESWDVTNGSDPKRLSRLDFGKPNETVRGSAFDLTRNVAYAITALQVDPLYAIDLSNRSDLKILSQIDGLSGDMSVFRLAGDNKFLLGIGRDTSDACTGFDANAGWASTKLALSIIDVRDLSKVRLVQRSCVATKNAAWVSSAITWNMDQAHKMLGMYAEGDTNVLTVPVSYWAPQNSGDAWSYRSYETAVGVMSWDLSRYDETKPETQQTVIRNHGTVIHPHGEVKRSVVFKHTASNRRTLLNLSDTHVSVTDLQDLDAPSLQADVEVAPYHSAVFKFGNHIVERVEPDQTGSYWYGNYQQRTEFRVKEAGGVLDGKPVLASFSVGQVQRVIQHGTKLVLLQGTGSVSALVYDMSNPLAPRRVGTVVIPSTYIPYPYFSCGWGGYWNSYWFSSAFSGFAQTTTGVAMLNRRWLHNGKEYAETSSLVYLDLQSGPVPTVSELKLPAGPQRQYTGVVSDAAEPDGFFATYRENVDKVTVNGQTLQRFREFAQRWTSTAGALKPGHAINTPGTIVNTWKGPAGTRLLLTNELKYVWQADASIGSGGYLSQKTRMNLLEQVKEKAPAVLLDSRPNLRGYVSGLIREGNRLFVSESSGGYYYYSGSYAPASDRLLIFDMSQRSLRLAYDEPTMTFGMQLMGTHEGRLFINLPGDGVLMVDATGAVPRAQKFIRTLGYAASIDFAGEDAYIASGSFGLHHLLLNAPPDLAVE